MRSVAAFVTGALCGALIAFGAYHFDVAGVRSSLGSSEAYSQSANPAEHTVKRASFTALGTVKPKDGLINISSPLLGQRIDFVIDKDPNADDILVVLDKESTETEVKLAETQLAEAREQQELAIYLADEQIKGAQDTLDQIEKSRDSETKVYQVQLSAVQDKARQAAKDHGRLVDLKEQTDALTSEQDIEHAALAVKAVEAEIEAAHAAKRRLEQTFDSQKKAAEAQLRSATKQKETATKGNSIESLEHQVALANLKLERTTVRSPISGNIVKRFVRAGELVSQQPLVQIANLNSLVCVVEVDAADIRHVKEQQPAIISCRALDDRQAMGRVVSIGKTVHDAVVQSFSPLTAVDRDAVDVVVEITDAAR